MTSKLFAGAALTAVASIISSAAADVLLEVDVSVPDTITITATDGLSAGDASGSVFEGVYLADFFNSFIGQGFTISSGTGDLTAASVPSDGSPGIFRASSTVNMDPGLNIWAFSASSPATFTTGEVAFSGSGTFTVDALDYADFLGANLSGDIFFPADSATDLPQTFLGTYTVIVPEPATAGLLSVVGLGLLRRRRA
jgi:hypothetical protein